MTDTAAATPAKPKTPNDWFYQRTLAPKLAKLGKFCQKRGLSFLAVVQIDPGKHGRTEVRTENIDLGMALLQIAVMAGTNVDSYVINAGRLVEGKLHSAQLGHPQDARHSPRPREAQGGGEGGRGLYSSRSAGGDGCRGRRRRGGRFDRRRYPRG